MSHANDPSPSPRKLDQRGFSSVLTVGSYWPYMTTLWGYTRRAMPYLTPGVLSADHLILTETTLPHVEMPNRDGFIADPRPDVPTRSSPVR